MRFIYVRKVSRDTGFTQRAAVVFEKNAKTIISILWRTFSCSKINVHFNDQLQCDGE